MPAKVSEDYVYLDYAATAPLCEEAARAMEPYQVPGRANLMVNANANSLHSPGRAAFEAMEHARRTVARALGAKRPDEIIFTSGATEADNAVIFGIVSAVTDAKRRAGQGGFTPHVIVSSIEHEAVLQAAHELAQRGCRVSYVDPDARGFVTPDVLERVIDDDTVLVSVQMANSEVGSIQPVADLAHIAHSRGALFHTDAVQALGKTPVDLAALDVDAASFAAHKIGGPKGVGALYLRTRAPFDAFMVGGGQEGARRSGTQNVAGIVGFAAACETVCGMVDAEIARLGALRDKLYAALSSLGPVTPTVAVEPGSRAFLPNIVHVLVDGFESETLILRLDMEGFGISGGSACASHSLDPSHVLKAMGVSRDRALGALRISMGRYTTEDDIDAFLTAFVHCLEW